MRRLSLGPALVAGVLLLAAAFAASNSVPASNVGRVSQTITPDALKPPPCSGITVTALRTGSGTFSGTSAAELVLGSAGPDTIAAAGRADCVLGGGGNDSLNGGAGTDVCIGGPGTDSFNANCEVQIQ